MTEKLLTRTIITRNLFKQADLAAITIDWFEVVERELGSTSSEHKVKFEIKGTIYVFVVHTSMNEVELRSYINTMLRGL